MSLLVYGPRPCLRGRQATPIEIRRERGSDTAARERLLDAAFGASRFAKTSERLREGRAPADGLAFVASARGRIIGTIRLWSVTAGRDRPCLLLGPLAVAADAQCQGVGDALMRHALHKAASLRHGAVLLVGDVAYYSRFGFSAKRAGALCMPGPCKQERLLGCELVPGALNGASGMIAAGRPPQSRWSRIMDGLRLEKIDAKSPPFPAGFQIIT
jgi:predicted N-acetyltransferase YhbS